MVGDELVAAEELGGVHHLSHLEELRIETMVILVAFDRVVGDDFLQIAMSRRSP